VGAIVGIGAGALLASPVIALRTSPLANADTPDLTGGGDGVDGSISYIDIFPPDAFGPTDPGLADLASVLAISADALERWRRWSTVHAGPGRLPAGRPRVAVVG
jgi:hypothetical protein